MKKTTYIILGTILTIFILLFLFPLFLNKIENKKSGFDETFLKNKYYVSKKYTNIKAIKFTTSSYNIPFYCNTIITPCDSDITSVSIPDSKYFSSSQKGDTLIIALNFKTQRKFISRYYGDNISIRISTPNNLSYISNENINNTLIEGMKGDSISCNINNSTILFNSSTFRAISFNGSSSLFQAKKSTIDSLYLDYDNYLNCDIESSNIDTEFITGSSYVEKNIEKDKCKKIVWIPKGNDSKIAISGKQKVILTPCK